MTDFTAQWHGKWSHAGVIARFEADWSGGVAVYRMAATFGLAQSQSIYNKARDLGLPWRRKMAKRVRWRPTKDEGAWGQGGGGRRRRRCLTCGGDFMSAGFGNRACRPCGTANRHAANGMVDEQAVAAKGAG